jgi:hypothetical protein
MRQISFPVCGALTEFETTINHSIEYLYLFVNIFIVERKPPADPTPERVGISSREARSRWVTQKGPKAGSTVREVVGTTIARATDTELGRRLIRPAVVQ